MGAGSREAGQAAAGNDRDQAKSPAAIKARYRIQYVTALT
jgi:hypothetical protein